MTASLVFSRALCVSSFCGNKVLKIASLPNGPLLSQVLQAEEAHSGCMIHSLLIIIPLSFQLPLLGYLMVEWGRGGSHYEAGVSSLWLAGGIRLICCLLHGVHPRTPPPLSARPDSIHTQQCAVSVPARISALHREERISSTARLICIYIHREAQQHPRLQPVYIKPGTPIAEASFDLLSQLWQDSGTTFLCFILFWIIYKLFGNS